MVNYASVEKANSLYERVKWINYADKFKRGTCPKAEKSKPQAKKIMNFDVIIAGGGAAGISAAIWCAELGLNALLLEKDAEPGGQLLWTYNPVKNHLGIEAENGRELRDAFVAQSQNFDFTLRTGAEIVEFDLDNKAVTLASGENFTAQALIIATGVSRRKLNVRGEEKFKGAGILTSGKRDKNSVKEKSVVIVGGGDAALENALILAETAAEVTVIHHREKFRARDEFIEEARKNSKIKFLTETVVRKISGNTRVEVVELEKRRSGEIHLLPTEAVLIRAGVEPNTHLLRGKVDLDERDYVKINSLCETNVEGVWAIGDVANPTAPTVSSAVGMGATAAKAILERLNR